MIKHRIDLNQLLPENPITVEVGCAECNYSLDIVGRWKSSKHFAVDVWEHIPNTRGDGNQPEEWHASNYDKCIDKFKPYLDRVVLLRGISWAMAQYIDDNSVDFISIDACHSYECVKQDIKAYWPKLKQNGIITFHDYEATEYGVKQAVLEHAQATNQEVHLLPENKQEDAGAYIVKRG